MVINNDTIIALREPFTTDWAADGQQFAGGSKPVEGVELNLVGNPDWDAATPLNRIG